MVRIVADPARPRDTGTAAVAAYRLTARERDVTAQWVVDHVGGASPFAMPERGRSGRPLEPDQGPSTTPASRAI